MEKITPARIVELTEELKQALLENVSIDSEEIDVQKRKAKNNKRLQIVRDELRALKIQ